MILIAFATASCSRAAGHTSVFSHISLLGSEISRSTSGPDTTVPVVGTLSIDGKAVAVTPPQRDLLRDCFASAIALRNDALATGAAGVATAGQAIGSIVSRLDNGMPDETGPAVAKVEVLAAKVCADLSRWRAKQDALGTQLAAFRPYATIDAGQVAKCNSSQR